MKKSKLCNYVIPGDKPGVLIFWYSLLCILLTGVFSARYFSRFGICYFDDNGAVFFKRYVLECGSVFNSSLNVALNKIFIGSTVFMLICIVMIVRNYYFFHNDSKSIYLMKRLSKPSELHRRCLTFPIVAILINILFTAVLLYLYYLYYRHFVANSNYSFNLWEVFL